MNSAVDFNSLPTVLWQKDIDKQCGHYVYGRYGCLDHFAVNLITPNKKVINLCPNLEYIKSYTELGMSRHENALEPWCLEGFPVVPWRMVTLEQSDESYHTAVSFKESIHSLYSGMSFIHPVGDSYLNVAVASKSPKKKHMITFFNNAEEILNLGAFILSLFDKKISGSHGITIPAIDEIVLNNGHLKKIDQLSRDWSDLGVMTSYPLI